MKALLLALLSAAAITGVIYYSYSQLKPQEAKETNIVLTPSEIDEVLKIARGEKKLDFADAVSDGCSVLDAVKCSGAIGAAIVKCAATLSFECMTKIIGVGTTCYGCICYVAQKIIHKKLPGC